jgi:hypothetical protein
MLLYQKATFTWTGAHHLRSIIFSPTPTGAACVFVNIPSPQQVANIRIVEPGMLEKYSVNLKEAWFPGLRKVIAVQGPKGSRSAKRLKANEAKVRKAQGKDVEVVFVYA